MILRNCVKMYVPIKKIVIIVFGCFLLSINISSSVVSDSFLFIYCCSLVWLKICIWIKMLNYIIYVEFKEIQDWLKFSCLRWYIEQPERYKWYYANKWTNLEQITKIKCFNIYCHFFFLLKYIWCSFPDYKYNVFYNNFIVH